MVFSHRAFSLCWGSGIVGGGGAGKGAPSVATLCPAPVLWAQ